MRGALLCALPSVRVQSEATLAKAGLKSVVASGLPIRRVRRRWSLRLRSRIGVEGYSLSCRLFLGRPLLRVAAWGRSHSAPCVMIIGRCPNLKRLDHFHHFHQSPPHVQPQLRTTLMDEFEVRSGFSYWQR
jgi:hypothetical protein